MNIPDIAMKLLTISCECHETTPVDTAYILTTDVIKQYNDKYPTDPVSDKRFSLAFRYLEEKNLIRFKKRALYGIGPSYIEVTAVGFDNADPNFNEWGE